jgi:tRNA(fMet)-specific endonuclease VapC
LAFLLDTSVAIYLRDGVAEVQQRVGAMDEAPSMSAVTRVELEGGVYANPLLLQRRRSAVDAILAELEVIDFDDSMAAAYGNIVEAAGFSRRKVIDRIIAATALAHDLTLVTCNGDDFRDIPGLKLEVWANPPT